MKALSLHQPWASLVALGVKTIETRSWSTKYRGPLAIHAGAKRPATVWLGPNDDLPPAIDRVGMPWEWTEGDDYYGSWRWVGPLGVIVATCTLVDVVPMVHTTEPRNGYCLVVGPPGTGMTLHGAPTAPGVDVSGQRPYGDFSPGRYAWLLDDIKPTSKRCPNECRVIALDGEDDCCADGHYRVCTGSTSVGGGTLEAWATCPVCNGVGTCDPIPARGRQGLWEWTP